MIVTLVLFAVLTFDKTEASIWDKNKDCHSCGINHGDSEMVDSEIVVNGSTVDDPGNKYPWIVAIYRKKKFLCTGSIISSKYILTAAHCLTKGDTSDTDDMKPDVLKVVLGFEGKDGDEEEVSEVSIYDDFKLTKKDDFEHDIGLLKLKKEYKCSKRAYPICVPNEDLERMDKKLTIAGFGHDKNKDRKKPITDVKLKKGKMKQVDSKECKKAGPNTGPRDSIVCGVSEDTEQIACEGDSGSPTFWKFDGVYHVLGVSSAISGKGKCVSDAKSTYSKIYYYRSWIKDKVGKLPKPYKHDDK